MKLYTRKEIAAKFGVALGTVTKWEQAGLPVAKPGSRGTPSRFELAAVRKWRREREAAGRDTGAVDLVRERARKERAQAELAEQTIQVRAGELLLRADVEATWNKEISAVRAKLLSWPAVLSDQLGRAFELGGVLELEKRLQAAVEELLTELSQPANTPAPRKAPAKKKKASSSRTRSKSSRKKSAAKPKKKPARKKKKARR